MCVPLNNRWCWNAYEPSRLKMYELLEITITTWFRQGTHWRDTVERCYVQARQVQVRYFIITTEGLIRLVIVDSAGLGYHWWNIDVQFRKFGYISACLPGLFAHCVWNQNPQNIGKSCSNLSSYQPWSIDARSEKIKNILVRRYSWIVIEN